MALERLDGTWVSVNPACADPRHGGDRSPPPRPTDFTHPLDVGIDTDRRRRLLDGEIASYQVEKRWRGRGGGVVWTHPGISLDKGVPTVRRTTSSTRSRTSPNAVQIRQMKERIRVDGQPRTAHASDLGAQRPRHN